MKTIETSATIAPDGKLHLHLHLPPDMPPGEYRVVLVMEEQPAGLAGQEKRPPLSLPVHDLGPWPAGLSLRREDIYGDDER
jgi:hypothetical protein